MQIEFKGIEIENAVSIAPALINISEKKFTVISGKNGIGKSLFLKKVYTMLLEKGHEGIYIEQSNNMLIEQYSILENITLTKCVDDEIKVKKMLEQYDLSYLLRHSVSELSGGELRLVCLLRGLFHATDILLIDEPTNDLDINAVNKLIKIIEAEKKVITIVAVTHDDRIKNIADDTIIIQEGKLLQNREICTGEKVDDVENLQNNMHTDLLIAMRETLTSDCLSKICALLVFVIFGYMVINVLNEPRTIYPYIADNEINITIPLSDYGAGIIGEGGIPIAALQCLDDNISIFQKVKLLSNIMEASDKLTINYGLNIPSNENYEVFELEYYIPQERTFYYTLDKYGQVFFDDEEVNTSNYFKAYGDDSKSKKMLQIDDFRKVQETLRSELEDIGIFENTYVAISLKQDDFFDFISSETCKNLMYGNYYIRSNETIELMNQINEFKNRKKLFIETVVIFIFAIILSTSIDIIIMYVNKKTILVYRNMGISKELLQKTILKKYNSIFYFVCGTGYLIGGLLVFYLYDVIDLVGIYIPLLLAFVCIGGMSVIRRIIIERYCVQICDWRFRW